MKDYLPKINDPIRRKEDDRIIVIHDVQYESTQDEPCMWQLELPGLPWIGLADLKADYLGMVKR